MSWLMAFYHEQFTVVEWIRSVGISVFGTWFVLAGCWLVWRSRVALWILGLSLAGAVLLFGFDVLLRG
jgi:hypothetical protein